jgi:phosphate transport system permease protein
MHNDLLTAPPGSGPPPAAEARRRVTARPSLPDLIFRSGVRGAGFTILATMGLIGLFLLLRSLKAWQKAGLGFFTESEWSTGTGKFGIAAVLTGTVEIALVALSVGVPIAIAAALYISEYAPARLRRTLIALVDLMAAVPSIVYGLWGVAFLQPRIIGLSRWLSDHLGFIPILKTEGPSEDPNTFTSSTFIAGIVVGMMVIPICCSLSREVFSQAPRAEREAAYALGATRWGMIRTVVLPFGRGGVIGATMLSLGRALGETIAVALIISPSFVPTFHILQGGGNSISAHIALRFQESSEFALSALMAAGLVLFGITLVVNFLSAIVVKRSRSGAATEA